MNNILVVDDELSIRESFSFILKGRYDVILAASGEAALKTVADRRVDLVFLDIRMPGLDGLETLKRMKKIDPRLEIVMVTAVNDIQKAGEAVNLGARDYVVKPFDVDQILKISDQILRKRSILELSDEARKNREKPSGLLGRSDKIVQLRKTIDKTENERRVLILGESGTEKEAVARLLHDKAGSPNAPFRAFYLSPAMRPGEIKNLLFGSEKGSSTADLNAESGLLEQTRNGTLFLGNIESLPLDALKVISSSEFSRSGGAARIPIETRLIGGSAPDLAEKNKECFDFFSEAIIQVPPLRERLSDIPFLTESFLEKYNSRFGKNTVISDEAIEALSSYSWPGNMDELEGLINILVLSCPDQISLEDLPLDILLKTSEGSGSGFLSAFEKEYIHRVYGQSGKDREKTAAFLGLTPAVLDAKI